MRFCFILLAVILASCSNSEPKDATPQPQLSPKAKQDRLALYKSYSPAPDSIGETYFSYFGFRDWYRWPLVYPYSLNAIDERDNGFLCDESNAVDITGSQKGIDQIHLGDIKSFDFNQVVLIAKTNSSKPFTLFDFKTKETLYFQSEKELRAELKQRSSFKNYVFMTIEEYSLIFN